MSYFIEISVKEAADKILNAQDTLVLDARDAHSYKDGHLVGAMQAHGGLVEHLIQTADRDRPVLVYCYHGTSSKDLANVFGRAGFVNCYSMRGGYTAWKKRDSLYAKTPYSEWINEWLCRECFEPQALNATIDGHITPLMLACQQAEVDIVDELLAAGAETEARNSDGNTALWFACYAECLPCIELLLTAGADINHQNGDGVSALMYAASAGKSRVVHRLLEKGANPALKNADDFTALDLAAEVSIVKLLKHRAGEELV